MPTLISGFVWTSAGLMTPSRLNSEWSGGKITFAGNNVLIGRQTAGAGDWEEIACVAQGFALLANGTTAQPQFANIGAGVAAAGTILFKGLLQANQQLLTASQGAGETSGANLVDVATTWNNGGNTPTLLKFNVTDTASNAASKLLDLQVGGASKFAVQKDGTVVAGIVPVARVTGLATVATSGQYNDLAGRPALAAVATSGNYSDLSNRVRNFMFIASMGAGFGGLAGPRQYTAVDISSLGLGSTPLGVANCNSEWTVCGQYDYDNSSSGLARVNFSKMDLVSDATGTYRGTLYLQ